MLPASTSMDADGKVRGEVKFCRVYANHTATKSFSFLRTNHTAAKQGEERSVK